MTALKLSCGSKKCARVCARVILSGCPIDYSALVIGLHWAPIGSARCVCVCYCAFVLREHHSYLWPGLVDEYVDE